MIVNKEFVNFISFTQWVKKFLNFKPQGVASFTASAALYGFQHSHYSCKPCALHLRQNGGDDGIRTRDHRIDSPVR
jgi:hypothetical protein